MILTAENISFAIGEKKILSNVNYTFAEKKITTIIGPNGAGKSTLLKILCLLNEKFSGRVILNGEDIRILGRKKISQSLAILPQEHEAPQDTTVRQLASFGRFPHRNLLSGDSKKDADAINWALEVTKLTAFENRQVTTLSGGERQRAWLAMALAQQPKILLLDEPTTYLDIAHQLEVMEIVSELNKNFSMTIIMVLHDINHARKFSDEILVVKNQGIFLSGEPEKVLTAESVENIFGVEAESFKNSAGEEIIFPTKIRSCFHSFRS